MAGFVFLKSSSKDQSFEMPRETRKSVSFVSDLGITYPPSFLLPNLTKSLTI
jgi:hypothetical protein